MYNQQYPVYSHQIIYPGQSTVQQPQPIITIINPAMQYQQPHHPYSMFPGMNGGAALGTQQMINQQVPNEIGYQSYQPHNQNEMTVSGNSLTLIPSQQNRPLKQAQMNTSMIIGTDSQFFYPPSGSLNNNGTSQDNSLVNNNEDDSSIHLPPKQLSQIVIPQNQLLFQQPIYQPHNIGGAMHQQQLHYPPHHQSQIYQQPPPVYIPQNYVQPHMRQASDSFQQQQQFQGTGMNTNQSTLS